jgi:hypothetical protein
MKSLFTACQWIRPREWNNDLVTIAVETDATLPLEGQMAVQWVRYQWYADTGDNDKAREAIEWILRQDLPRADRLTWEWEFVWLMAFSLRSGDGARERASIAERLTPPRLTNGESREVWKGRAAIAACEGRIDAARDAAVKAVAFAKADKRYPAALLRALESDLMELLATGPESKVIGESR